MSAPAKKKSPSALSEEPIIELEDFPQRSQPEVPSSAVPPPPPVPPAPPQSGSVRRIEVNGRIVEIKSVPGATAGKQSVVPTPSAEYAGFWVRLAAFLVDEILLCLAFVLVRKVFGSHQVLAYLALRIGYTTYFQASGSQATPGKRFMGLKVTTLTGERISGSSSLVRSVTQLASGLVFCLGYLFMFQGGKKQTAHDRMAETLVIIDTPSSQAKIALTVILGLFLAFKLMPVANTAQGKTVPVTQFKTLDVTEIDPCLFKSYCVTVYITPWCPACHKSIPFMKQVRDSLASSPKTGFRFIVGQDSPEKLEALAKELGNATGIDAAGEFSRRMNIDTYPTWLVWRTSDRKVISTPAAIAMHEQLSPEQLRLLLPRFLEMDEADLF